MYKMYQYIRTHMLLKKLSLVRFRHLVNSHELNIKVLQSLLHAVKYIANS